MSNTEAIKKLVQEIKGHIDRCDEYQRMSLEYKRKSLKEAKQAGQKMLKLKPLVDQKLGPRKWLKWRNKKFAPCASSTLDSHVQIAKYWDAIIEPALKDKPNLGVKAARDLITEYRASTKKIVAGTVEADENGIPIQPEPLVVVARKEVLLTFKQFVASCDEEELLFLASEGLGQPFLQKALDNLIRDVSPVAMSVVPAELDYRNAISQPNGQSVGELKSQHIRRWRRETLKNLNAAGLTETQQQLLQPTKFYANPHYIALLNWNREYGIRQWREPKGTIIYYSGSPDLDKILVGQMLGRGTDIEPEDRNDPSTPELLKRQFAIMPTFDPRKKMEPLSGVRSSFVDSGAYSLKDRAEAYAKEHGDNPWGFYDTPEFWNHMEKYIEFLRNPSIQMNSYANLDAIGNAEISWRNLEHMEKHGLSPVPVFHCPDDFKWLKRMLDKGYEYIGIGGLTQKRQSEECMSWLDECFSIICDTPDRTPRVKVHGFGMTSVPLMLRYPWYSVDSTTWRLGPEKAGLILVPKFRHGMFKYKEIPHRVTVATKAKQPIRPDQNHLLLKIREPALREWLNLIGLPFGNENEKGVSNDRDERHKANLFYFQRLQEHLPEYPRPFALR